MYGLKKLLQSLSSESCACAYVFVRANIFKRAFSHTVDLRRCGIRGSTAEDLDMGLCDASRQLENLQSSGQT